jgi:hypothetical protein
MLVAYMISKSYLSLHVDKGSTYSTLWNNVQTITNPELGERDDCLQLADLLLPCQLHQVTWT